MRIPRSHFARYAGSTKRTMPTLQGRSPAASNTLILVFFFLTGLTGLAYELVWIRLLILAFGSTQFAVTTVLVTFMAGLALGSVIFGRLIDRFENPLRVYAIIEILLGVYCILSPAVFQLVRKIYLYLPTGHEAVTAGFEPSQFALSFLALIIPTTLMGGTLPALVKYLASSSDRVGFHTAVPYSINTLGAVTGCLATGLFSLYVLGVKSTLYTAGVVDIIVGAIIYYTYAGARSGAVRHEAKDAKPSAASTASPALGYVVIGSFALSGFASLSYEVLWTRVFSLVIGSSVYAFTVMLATFLVGIGAGSIIFAPIVDKCKRPLFWFAVLEAVIGIVAIVSVFAYKELPFIFYSMKGAFGEQFWAFLFLQFLLCSAIMIIPTLCMGAIFPLVGRIYTRGLETVARNIGEIYFFNTAGSIFGAFIAGFILIPFIGVQNGVVLTAAINIIICIALLFHSEVRKTASAVASAALVVSFIAVAFALPPWEKIAMTMGLYVNPVVEGKVSDVRQGRIKEELVYYKEGVNAVVTVRTEDGGNVVAYQANGKQEARSTGGEPTAAWAILGHLPLLMHQGTPSEALVIGLGSGITLGAMEHYPLKGFDVVELEPAVVEASTFFKAANNDAINDPRVRLHVTDGRTFLFTGKRKYDVIVSGVSDPWISGVSNLFTYEYFVGLRDKVADDGIVGLWFQNYRITPEELKVGIGTFAKAFPYVSVWFHYTDALDLVVIGSKNPHSLDMDRLASVFTDSANASAKKGLARININNPYDVLDLFLIGNVDLRAYIGEVRLNTDERPILEFTLPKHMYMDPSLGVKTVEEIIGSTADVVPPVKVAEADRVAFYLNLGKTYNRSSFRLDQALKAFEKALELDPGSVEARRYIDVIRAELGHAEKSR